MQGSSKLEGGEVSNPMDAVKEEGAAAAPTAAQQDVEKKETRVSLNPPRLCWRHARASLGWHLCFAHEKRFQDMGRFLIC